METCRNMEFEPIPESPPAQLEPGDCLIGGDEIAEFVNELLGTDVNVQTVYGWILRKKIPAGKFGSRVMGSRRTIREALARSAGMAA
jgi:hypothetical protein